MTENNWQILLDADNVPLDQYILNVKPIVAEIVGTEIIDSLVPTVYTQSHVIFKYSSQREETINVRCCKTLNRNATDANILFEAGKSRAEGRKVVIVSNDKIFKEIEDGDGIQVVTVHFDKVKKPKLRRKTILKLMQQLRVSPAHDVFLSDLLQFFPHLSLFDLRAYLANIHDIRVNANDSVYTIKV